uniref:Uncharacterized protein n=1 Tax=Anguilla anguilla TaxID=7936 RepID=A0A0E9R4Y5_ANGAN
MRHEKSKTHSSTFIKMIPQSFSLFDYSGSNEYSSLSTPQTI